MALSNHTLRILRNFTKINNNLDLVTGRVLKTIHPMGTVVGEAQINQDIPAEFSIVDLKKFLAMYHLSKDAGILSFGLSSDGIVIRDRRGITTYAGVSSVQNRSLYENSIKFSESDKSIRFVLSPTEFRQIVRHARVLKLRHLSVFQAGFMLSDRQRRSEKVMFQHPVETDSRTEVVFLMKYLKMLIPAYYQVTIADKKAKFSSLDSRLKIDYFVATED